MNPPSEWASFRALVRWDFTREMKRKDTLVAMGMTALVTLFLFSFAIPPTRAVLLDTRAGILWVTFLLAATIGVDRAFRGDGDGRLLEGLLLAPIGRATLYYARVTSSALFVITLQAATLVLFLVLFNQSIPASGLAALCAAAVGTTVGFCAVGVLLSAMTCAVRGGDVLLRILLFPMAIPLLAAAVAVTDKAFRGVAPTPLEIGGIAAFDLVFLGAGHMLFEHLVRDVGPQG